MLPPWLVTGGPRPSRAGRAGGLRLPYSCEAAGERRRRALSVAGAADDPPRSRSAQYAAVPSWPCSRARSRTRP
jgi:hypothetical protein